MLSAAHELHVSISVSCTQKGVEDDKVSVGANIACKVVDWGVLSKVKENGIRRQLW